MSEEAIERRLHELRKLGERHAKAVANKTELEHGRKILLAELMKQYMINSNGKLESVNAQEREARSDPRYKKHIKRLAVLTGQEIKFRWQKRLIEINYETWKVKQYNMAQEARAYGVEKT
tara:strand:- start:145 stop:504 length:360 start_codon:yes stop_codon:yes gene_type:complete